MGKTKAQRKQDKKEAMQQTRKQEQQKQQEKEILVEESEAATKTKYEPEQIDLTPYTAVYMIATLVSAAAAMLSMVMLAKPAIYFLENMIGTAMDEAYYEIFSEIIYFEIGKRQVYGIYILVAVLSVVTVVLTMVGMMKATRPEKKPTLVLNLISVICAIAALIVFICEGRYLYDFVDTFGIANEPIWGVYRILYVILVCNVVFATINLAMSSIALGRWKKTGTTGKNNL